MLPPRELIEYTDGFNDHIWMHPANERRRYNVTAFLIG